MIDEPDEGLLEVLLRLAQPVQTRDVAATVDILLDAGTALLRADGAVVMLDDGSGVLRVARASGPASRAIAEAGLRHGGPGRTSHETRRVVTFAQAGARLWPRYAAEVRRQGIHEVHVSPIATRDKAIGSYALHWARPARLSPHDRDMALALARMAAVGILNGRRIEEQLLRVDQLQEALDSRVLIEQAKGVLAARAGMDPAVAFERLRAASRATGRPLVEVAADVIRGVVAAAPSRSQLPVSKRPALERSEVARDDLRRRGGSGAGQLILPPEGA